MKKAKLVAIVAILIAAIIIFAQNTEMVQVEILFWTRQMSGALLMLLIFGLGALVGILTTTFFLRKKSPRS